VARARGACRAESPRTLANRVARRMRWRGSDERWLRWQRCLVPSRRGRPGRRPFVGTLSVLPLPPAHCPRARHSRCISSRLRGVRPVRRRRRGPEWRASQIKIEPVAYGGTTKPVVLILMTITILLKMY
jgi:hypothetical protein